MQKVNRLTNNASFNYLYRNGKPYGSHYLTMFIIKASGQKIGISVSKKVGNSVTRNRIKRRIRESATALLPSIANSFNCVIVAKESASEADFHMLNDNLIYLFRKAGYIPS